MEISNYPRVRTNHFLINRGQLVYFRFLNYHSEVFLSNIFCDPHEKLLYWNEKTPHV